MSSNRVCRVVRDLASQRKSKTSGRRDSQSMAQAPGSSPCSPTLTPPHPRNPTNLLHHVPANVITHPNAMSSPYIPISKLIPRISRRRPRCDGPRHDRSSRASRRWMSSTQDAPTKRPKTAIFFPGKFSLHHLNALINR
jgi:hypothetical protein